MLSAIRFCLPAIALLLAACGGGGGSDSEPAPDPSLPPATFAFRIQGAGAEQEFRYATSSQAFIAAARAQLSLPVIGRKQFPSGPITAGNDGANLSWGWQFTDLAFTEASTAVCDGTPSMVQADIPYWVNTVKRFCPWSAYVYAETTGSYPVTQFAIGQTRAIPQENMTIEFKDLADTRCGAAAMCVTQGYASVDLVVRIGNEAAQQATVFLGAGDRDQQTIIGGSYRITLDSLEPYPITSQRPKEEYRAAVTVRRL
jgi:hypothetical protein